MDRAGHAFRSIAGRAREIMALTEADAGLQSDLRRPYASVGDWQRELGRAGPRSPRNLDRFGCRVPERCAVPSGAQAPSAGIQGAAPYRGAPSAPLDSCGLRCCLRSGGSLRRRGLKSQSGFGSAIKRIEQQADGESGKATANRRRHDGQDEAVLVAHGECCYPATTGGGQQYGNVTRPPAHRWSRSISGVPMR